MAERADKPGQGAQGGSATPRGTFQAESPESQDRPQRAPHLTAGTQAGKASREARLAAEMRKNLQKRKRQRRARDGRTPRDD